MRTIETKEYQCVFGGGDYGDDDPPPAIDSDWMPGMPYIGTPKPQYPPALHPYSIP
jgi:hypothetical protein